MRTLIPLVITVALLSAVAAGYWWTFIKVSEAQEAQGAPPGIVVEAAPAVTGTSVRKLKAVGTLVSNQSVIVRPEIAGRLMDIHFEDGATVVQGTVLAELDQTVLAAELADAEAERALAAKEYKRAEELLKRGTGTKARRDETLAALNSGDARVALARARLGKMTITAPFDGTLGIRRVDVGAYLSAGDDIVNLEQIQPIKVSFEVPERFMAGLFPAKEVTLKSDAYPGKVFRARVNAIDPMINPRTRSIEVQAIASNSDRRLKPGQFVSVTIRVDERVGAVFVPEQALLPNSETPLVYRIEDGIARPIPVDIGIRISRHVEILSGVSAGDLIVTAGQQRLGDGVPVVPREPTFVPPSPPDEEIQVIDDN